MDFFLKYDHYSKIAEWLSPVDVAHLGACSRQIRLEMAELAKAPLRMQIATTAGLENGLGDNIDPYHALGHRFFVSDASTDRMLRVDENLVYGKKYRFWISDRERCQQVNLKYDFVDSDMPDVHDIALKTKQRSRKDASRCFVWVPTPTFHNNDHDDRLLLEGQSIYWGHPLHLKGFQETLESCLSASFLYPSDSVYEEMGEYLAIGRPEDSADFRWFTSPNPTEHGWEVCSRDLTFVRSLEGLESFNHNLEIRAERVFRLGPSISIYSERSRKSGLVGGIARDHAVVKFKAWTTQKFFYMKAEALPFSIAFPPSLSTLSLERIENEPRVLITMYSVHEEYVYPMKYYFALAADKMTNQPNFPAFIVSLQHFASQEDISDLGEISAEDSMFVFNPVEEDYPDAIPETIRRELFCETSEQDCDQSFDALLIV